MVTVMPRARRHTSRVRARELSPRTHLRHPDLSGGTSLPRHTFQGRDLPASAPTGTPTPIMTPTSTSPWK